MLQRDTYMNYSRPLSTTSGANWSRNLSNTGGLDGGIGTNENGYNSQPKQRFKFRRGIRRAFTKIRYAAQENWRRAWVIMLWVAVMTGLFVWKFIQYRRMKAFHVMGYCLPTAKGAAETLKLNMALVLLPVCRNTLTWLRSTWARYFVPFDDNITFHKVRAKFSFRNGLAVPSIIVKPEMSSLHYPESSETLTREEERRGLEPIVVQLSLYTKHEARASFCFFFFLNYRRGY